MAKLTVSFEDVEDGVAVRVECDPPFSGDKLTEEERNSLTDAQQMGLRMTQLLAQEMASNQCHHGGCGREDCGEGSCGSEDCCHNHPEV